MIQEKMKMNKNKITIWMTIFLVVTIISSLCVSAAQVNIVGYIFYHNGSKVPVGTPVNLTQTATSVLGTTVTGGVDTNYYNFLFVTADNSGNDIFLIYSELGIYSGSSSNNGLGTVNINVTYDNIIPIFNASLPDLTMDEDNATGIDNAIDVRGYAFDYDGSPLTYSIFSQTNPGLVTASIDGNYIDISAPPANTFGTSDICVRIFDTEDFSTTDCFTVTVNSIPDNPTYTSAVDNITGVVKGGIGISISTVASDVDGDLVILYVCETPGATFAGCTGIQRCSNTQASNPSCIYNAETDINSHSWYAYIYDATGRISTNNYNETYTVDGTNPTIGSVSIEGGVTYIGDSTLDFTWAAFSDTGTGIRYYYYSYTDNSGTTSGTQVNNITSFGQLINAAQGVNTVYVWAQDQVGNIGIAASDSIIVDTEQPVLYDWTQNPVDLDEASSGAVTVTVRVNDTTWNTSNPLQLRYQYNSFGYSGWSDMTLIAGNQYSYVIPEPIATWSAFLDDWLRYQVQGTDMVGLSTTETVLEFIDVFNYAPVLDVIPFQVAYEDQNLSISLSATDADGDVLTFTSDYNFTIVSTSSTTAIAWWFPTGDDVGTNQVNFTVSDPFTSDSQIVNIDVTSGNDAPVLSTIGDLFAYEHIPFMHYIYGSDADNHNNYTLDNDLLIFDIEEPLRWFRMDSFFNATNASYYGTINFTPLLSHRGEHNITLYVEDCNMMGCKTRDTENILFTVGYCGDEDSGGEPWCDETYESCLSCKKDCGKCSSDEDEFMAIIIDPRNCLNRNFTIWTYMLYDRASCENEGLIVQDKEVCGNLSGVKVDIMLLEKNKWVKNDEFISDSNGEITFSTTTKGEYKLIATKSGYPTAYEYLEIGPCHKDEVKKEEIDITTNQSEKTPIEEKPTTTPEETKPGEIIPESSTISVILWYVVIPTLLIITMVLSYYYYDKNKNKVAWILKMRIFTRTKTKKYEKKFKKQWLKIKKYLRYDK
jgi:hypothetical protein